MRLVGPTRLRVEGSGGASAMAGCGGIRLSGRVLKVGDLTFLYIWESSSGTTSGSGRGSFMISTNPNNPNYHSSNLAVI